MPQAAGVAVPDDDTAIAFFTGTLRFTLIQNINPGAGNAGI
ncbi:MAG: hypothetical protein AAGB28_12440 [Pseudomonadota bacterium]